jgi:hypothetical protein
MGLWSFLLWLPWRNLWLDVDASQHHECVYEHGKASNATDHDHDGSFSLLRRVIVSQSKESVALFTLDHVPLRAGFGANFVCIVCPTIQLASLYAVFHILV